MTNPPPSAERRARPGPVTAAVALQLLLALSLAVSAVVEFMYGADAQEAYESELAAQGVDIADVPQSGGFGGGVNLVLSIVIIVLLVVLALLNGVGNRVGRILTWVFQPLVLICGGFLFAGQLFAARLTQWAFDNSGDETLESLDAKRLMQAATDAYPAWSAAVSWVSVVLAVAGSLVVIVLLAVPGANAYFRKEEAGPAYIPGAPTE